MLGVSLGYTGAHDDNRELALFRDTSGTENIGVKTWNIVSHVLRRSQGSGMRTVFRYVGFRSECDQSSVVEVRNER